MKLFLLLLLFSCTQAMQAQKGFQVKDNNKTKQVEQLQQLKQIISRKIDSLQSQLPQLAASMENTRKKIEELKKGTGAPHKHGTGAKITVSTISSELIMATYQADSLRRKFDSRLNALDQTLNLQKDLEDKINALIKENNR